MSAEYGIKKMSRRVKISVLCLLLLVFTPLSWWLFKAELVRIVTKLPDFTHSLARIESTQIPMRDGVHLNTSIYIPEGEGPWPTLLVRDPYSSFDFLSCEIYVYYGFACVYQDTRGRFDSEGEWYPVVNERNDGIDTLDWLVEQKALHNGNIALAGSSYVGMVQYAVADKLPPEVKTIMTDVTSGDWYEIVHHGGHFQQGIMSEWLGLLNGHSNVLQEVAAHRPAVEADVALLNEPRQWYRDYLLHPEKSDPYWNSETYRAIRNSYKSIDVPVLVTGAWHDFFIGLQLDMFEKLPTRNNSLMIVRQGDHGMDVGDLNIDANLFERFGEFIQQTLVWLNHHLKGQALTGPNSGYLLHMNQDDQWVHKNQWPSASSSQTFYLSNLPAASDCKGDLVAQVPPQGAVSYRYDPSDPVPTVGGSRMLDANLAPGASSEQGDLCLRQDILSFVSEPLNSTISGSVQVKLLVASDAGDSAFTVKLVEVFESGGVRNIRDDITSLSFRNNAKHIQSYQAGSKVELTFDLVPIEWQLSPGSRLRLDISSSNYPMYNVHPNLPGNWATKTESLVATQTLFEGSIIVPFSQNAMLSERELARQ